MITMGKFQNKFCFPHPAFLFSVNDKNFLPLRYKLRVEFPRGGGGPSFRGGDRGRNSDKKSNRPTARRSNYRVCVSGLPSTGSWQDLKDHMREAGDVCFADVYKDGTGVVEFLRHEDMRYAIKKLDDSRFRSHEGK